jgi:aminopeptidase N
MWIHEGFTTFTETVFIECVKGYDEAIKYVNGQSRSVRNDRPVIAQFGVNKEGSGDMYYKGALMLNTIRHIINDDVKWWKLLYNYSETYKKQIIDTKTVIDYFNKESGIDLTSVFNQYLTTTKIPKLVLSKSGNKLSYEWQNVNSDFKMPIDIVVNEKTIRLQPTNSKQVMKIDKKIELENIEVKTNQFFIKVEKK